MAEEIKNQGQQEYAENLNENVSGQAKEIISAALEETQNRETSPVLKADSNVTDKFKGLPMRELIAAPLIAAAEAQQELAATAWNFYQQIAFDGKSGNKARILEFDVERPIQQDGKMTTMSQSVKAPFIGIGAYSFPAHRSRGCRFPDGGYRYIKRKKHYQRRSRGKSFCKTLVYKCGNQRQSHDRPREHPHDQPNGKIPDTCDSQSAAADRRSV